MSNNKTLIIIGAGIAGLATGCYARMNGYDVRIFEMHDKPGGMCTSWQPLMRARPRPETYENDCHREHRGHRVLLTHLTHPTHLTHLFSW
jgi:uncharacterized protein with NAD-binding domain and iron-sulfur cluster